MLKKGDKVGIISPASYVELKDFQKGIDYLTSLGFECVLGENIFEKYYWMAGTPEQRASDINSFFKNPEIKAIFSTRGGVGSQKTLKHLDYKMIKQNHKPLFGHSDITSLQLGLYSQAGVVSYTGLLLMYDFKDGKIDKMVEQSLLEIIDNKQTNFAGGKTIYSGKNEGVLLGGTLSLLMGLAGTKYFPIKEDCVLLIEDVDERTYKLDLAFDQLKKNESFNKVKGIILGQFTDCENYKNKYIEIKDVISEFCKDLNIPIIMDFPYGHIKSKYILPIGKKVKLDANKCEVSIL